MGTPTGILPLVPPGVAKIGCGCTDTIRKDTRFA